MSGALEDRVMELEMRLAHHERMAEEFSDVIAQQARVLDLLTRQIHHLRERLGDMEAGGGGVSPQDEKPPPHY